ncbi:hypothetical protein NQZ68_034304 [Dissostichus eleginoides]|nr:hypothetical protein NQZ68_034304 [Dissostichus eleginoides]
MQHLWIPNQEKSSKISHAHFVRNEIIMPKGPAVSPLLGIYLLGIYLLGTYLLGTYLLGIYLLGIYTGKHRQKSSLLISSVNQAKDVRLLDKLQSSQTPSGQKQLLFCDIVLVQRDKEENLLLPENPPGFLSEPKLPV